MDLISLLVLVILFVAIVWGGFYICDRAGFPPPVKWIWGAICLVILISVALGQVGGGSEFLHRPRWGR